MRKNHRRKGKIRQTKILSRQSKAAPFWYEMGKLWYVVEQANIPKFNKLGVIGTPRIIFEPLFDDALVNMIVAYTKLYGHREKTDTSSENF